MPNAQEASETDSSERTLEEWQKLIEAKCAGIPKEDPDHDWSNWHKEPFWSWWDGLSQAPTKCLSTSDPPPGLFSPSPSDYDESTQPPVLSASSKIRARKAAAVLAGKKQQRAALSGAGPARTSPQKSGARRAASVGETIESTALADCPRYRRSGSCPPLDRPGVPLTSENLAIGKS